MSVLEEIIAAKRAHVAASKAKRSLAALEALAAERTALDFSGALETAIQNHGYGLICEVKKASPSKGVIQPNFTPERHASQYMSGGAACISVLTDTPYFQGSDSDLMAVRTAVDIPLLRKDFMIDPYQVTEAKAIGADCVLIILAAVSRSQALELEAAALDQGLQVLAEIHALEELEDALALKTPLIGVNNRNLKTLDVDPQTTQTVAQSIPGDRHVVAESGLTGHQDLGALKRIGIERFLIGEALMREDNQETAVKRFLGQAA
ncbi:MAG: indole-3-glycerol phosphate synthase TrpC [Sphingomonadales bacterium]